MTNLAIHTRAEGQKQRNMRSRHHQESAMESCCSTVTVHGMALSFGRSPTHVLCVVLHAHTLVIRAGIVCLAACEHSLPKRPHQ